MRAFLNSPGNELFAEGLNFDVGLDFDAKNGIEKSGPSRCKFFQPKVRVAYLHSGKNLHSRQIWICIQICTLMQNLPSISGSPGNLILAQNMGL